jgi:hypothetical protein
MPMDNARTRTVFESTSFWDSPVVLPCFRGTYCLYLHGRRASEGRSRLLLVGYLLGLLFDPKKKGSMLLRHIGELLLDYWELHPTLFTVVAARNSNPTRFQYQNVRISAHNKLHCNVSGSSFHFSAKTSVTEYLTFLFCIPELSVYDMTTCSHLEFRKKMNLERVDSVSPVGGALILYFFIITCPTILGAGMAQSV